MKKMMTFSDSKENRDNFTKDPAKARSEAVKYIGADKKTSLRVRKKLLDKGFEKSVIDRVIEELTSEGVLDDVKYAKAVLRSRTGRKAEGEKALLYRMLNLGIPEKVAADCISDYFCDPYKEREDAYGLLVLKFSSNICKIQQRDKKEREGIRQKYLRFLSSRGYKEESALYAVNKFVNHPTPKGGGLDREL